MPDILWLLALGSVLLITVLLLDRWIDRRIMLREQRRVEQRERERLACECGKHPLRSPDYNWITYEHDSEPVKHSVSKCQPLREAVDDA